MIILKKIIIVNVLKKYSEKRVGKSYRDINIIKYFYYKVYNSIQRVFFNYIKLLNNLLIILY